jgi:MerR family transcriptional regulator, copper efflux regulator
MGIISTSSLVAEAAFMSNGRMRDETLGITEAAGLFGLAPSTLRWWERSGLLDPRRGAGGRRRYGRAELNRIALVHLARNAGPMSLAEIGDLVTGLTGRGGRPRWHRAVRSRIAALDEQLAQLARARAYLQHSLECRHDDPAECPMFTREVIDLYPGLGRVLSPSERDETGVVTDAPGQPGGPRCRGCGARLTQPRTGRRRDYCSRACQQRAYRARRAQPARSASSSGDPE